MPVAEPFIAIGAGNGFPECLSSVNVSDCDFWTTFGGTNKTNVDSLTSAQLAVNKELSLKNAMKLYWNAYSVSGSATATGTTAMGSTATASVSDLIMDVEPKQRVCAGASAGNEDYKDDDDDNADVLVAVGSGYHMLPELDDVRRFYNGPTDNEDNFVGIGYYVVPDPENIPGFIPGNIPAEIKRDTIKGGISYEAIVFRLDGFCSIQLIGALTSNNFDLSFPGQQTVKKVAYVEVNGIHFVALVQATYYIGSGSSTLSATNSDISAAFSYSSTGDAGSCSFTLPGCFDFYTYP